MQEIALSSEFHPLHPQNLHPEGDGGDGGVFAPSSVPALLMTPDCRRSLMRIKWAPFHPSPSSSSSLHPSSPHAMQAFLLLLLLPISPIGRSLHHRGCQSGKTPTAGRGSPTQNLAHSMIHGVHYVHLFGLCKVKGKSKYQIYEYIPTPQPTSSHVYHNFHFGARGHFESWTRRKPSLRIITPSSRHAHCRHDTWSGDGGGSTMTRKKRKK